VFQAKVFLVDRSTFRQPCFELAGGFDYVHAGNDSGAGIGSQIVKAKPLPRKNKSYRERNYDNDHAER
jgi:hypothetical protein